MPTLVTLLLLAQASASVPAAPTAGDVYERLSARVEAAYSLRAVLPRYRDILQGLGVGPGAEAAPQRRVAHRGTRVHSALLYRDEYCP